MDELKPIVVEPFADESTFTVLNELFPGEFIDQYSNANPTAGEYEELMRQLKIK